jgi:hypothetical protein
VEIDFEFDSSACPLTHRSATPKNPSDFVVVEKKAVESDISSSLSFILCSIHIASVESG